MPQLVQYKFNASSAGSGNYQVGYGKYVCTEHYTAMGNMPRGDSVTRRLHCHSCHSTRGMPLLLAQSQNSILLRALNASKIKFAVCFIFAGMLSTVLSFSSKTKFSKFSGFSSLFSQVCRRLL